MRSRLPLCRRKCSAPESTIFPERLELRADEKHAATFRAAQPTEMIGSNNLMGVITPKVGDKKLAHF
jgi:hypothetical protein